MKTKLFLTIFGIIGLISLSFGANYDSLDPRLPDYTNSLLYRINVANGYFHTYRADSSVIDSTDDFYKEYYDYIKTEKRRLISRKNENVKFQGSVKVKEDWLGFIEDGENYGTLQTSLNVSYKLTIKDKIEICHDVTFFRTDSTYNFDNASTTGEYLGDPLLSRNFSGRGAIASSYDFFELQANKAYIKTNVLGIDIQTGRDRLQFKNGYRSALLFSGLTRSVDMYYRFDYSVWRFDYTALAGQLTETETKYISAKRLAFRAAHNLQFGVSEAVSYYDDPTAYINPIMLYYFLNRHRADNEENLLASFDFSYTPFKTFNIYGEFLDDDYIMFDGGASKYGFQLGLYKTDLITKRLDCRIEYAHVRKWTYTHVSYVNAWEYRDQPFGFWLGNDCDDIYCRFDYLINPTTSAALNLDYVRKGEGDLETPYEENWEQDDTPKFPSGIVEKAFGVWLDFRHEFRYLELRGRVGYRNIENRQNQIGKCDNYFTHWTTVIGL